MSKSTEKQHRHGRVALLATLLIVVVAIGVYLLLLRGHSKAAQYTGVPRTTSTIPSTKSNSSNSTSSSSSQTASIPPANQTTKSGGLGDAYANVLIAPSGNFVSDHHPSSTNFQEQSVCNTTPGASCYIEFSNGSVVEQLDSQTTDINGSAFWTWNISSAGLTPGSWTITAIASLNGQTKTANDSQDLVVPQ